MKRTQKHTAQEIADILDSDDELPDFYDETPELPAYLDDNRFAKVKPVESNRLYEGAANQQSDISLQTKPQQDSPESKEPVEELSTKPAPREDASVFQQCSTANQAWYKLVANQAVRTMNRRKLLISRGVLTMRDLFFIRSIEAYATDTTLLWFIDFLYFKAARLHQRSCLVVDIRDDLSIVAFQPIMDFRMRFYFQLVLI